MSSRIHLFCPRKFTFYVHKKSATLWSGYCLLMYKIYSGNCFWTLATAALATASYSGNCLWSYNGIFLMLILLKDQLWALATASKVWQLPLKVWQLPLPSLTSEWSVLSIRQLVRQFVRQLVRQPYQTALSDSLIRQLSNGRNKDYLAYFDSALPRTLTSTTH